MPRGTKPPSHPLQWVLPRPPRLPLQAPPLDPNPTLFNLALLTRSAHRGLGDGELGRERRMASRFTTLSPWSISRRMDGLGVDSLPIQAVQARGMLRNKLRTDADFVAFLLDYFPDIYYRISDGMDRLAKENLLLAIAGHEAIVAALNQYSVPIACAQSRESESPNSLSSTPLLQVPKHRLHFVQPIAGVFAFLALILLALVLRVHAWKTQDSAAKANAPIRAEQPPPSAQLSPQPARMSENQPVPAYIKADSTSHPRSSAHKTGGPESSPRLKPTGKRPVSTDDLADELNKPSPLE